MSEFQVSKFTFERSHPAANTPANARIQTKIAHNVCMYHYGISTSSIKIRLSHLYSNFCWWRFNCIREIAAAMVMQLKKNDSPKSKYFWGLLTTASIKFV